MSLIPAPNDQSSFAQWGCSENSIGGTSIDVGTGQTNTTLIVNACFESGIAAKLCDDLVIGMYDDWFLTSMLELRELHRNLHLNDLGGFASGEYWSSSSFIIPSAGIAWVIVFNDGFQNSPNKNNNYNFRAVRAF